MSWYSGTKLSGMYQISGVWALENQTNVTLAEFRGSHISLVDFRLILIAKPWAMGDRYNIIKAPASI